ncbi:MAG: SLC13 family permease [Spirochaetes bacterium]|nr:SLC13 family permease [Spirochaetota bacterium]
MTIEMITVLAAILAAVILFATEKLSVDLTALLIMGVLLLSGIITPGEGVSGFSNSATVTVTAMFVLSAALRQTGAVNYIGTLSSRLFGRSYYAGLAATMAIVALLSAFTNNTPVVAIFIPILMSVSKDNRLSPSRLLIPISFASMFGGVCTLIGTSTNILVSSIAATHGQQPFGMFEFTAMGSIFLLAGTAYMLLIGVRLLPRRSYEGGPEDRYDMAEYMTEIVVLPKAKSVGTRLTESPLVRELDIDVLDVIRNGKRVFVPFAFITLREGDVLRVRCDVKQLQNMKERMGIALKADRRGIIADGDRDDLLLVEAIVAHNSSLAGKTIRSARFRNSYRANALAMRHRGQLFRKNFTDTPLKPGDALLIEVGKEHYDWLKSHNDFVIVSDIERPAYRKDRIIPALLIVLGVIVVPALGLAPIMVTAIIGCILMVLVRCISMEEAYQAIEWRVIFLLGGILSLGIALEKTGTALYLAKALIGILGPLGPVAILAALYLLTSLLTEAMSNNATAVLLAPIAIVLAESLGVSPRPFLVAVTFAASSSFMTPVGYQTNTMVYGVGEYRFSDFLKVGAPLNLLFWVLATLLIPIFFPF